MGSRACFLAAILVLAPLSARSADLVVCIGLELEIGWLPSLLTGSRNPKVQPGAAGYLDASAAIGWEGIRRLEAPLMELMELAITRAAEAGRIAPRRPGPLASFLFGAVCEMAMIVARADDQKTAHREALAEIGRVLDGLVT